MAILKAIYGLFRAKILLNTVATRLARRTSTNANTAYRENPMQTGWLRVSQAALVLVGVLLLTQVASAQGVAGLVTDDTGGVLPGVTVTVASPALTEQQRIAITDGEGRYTFTDLRPGTYTVTFSLPGFNQILREGIELTTGFTANVNAELGVGGIEETITVTGASPVVDIQNVRRQSSIDAEALATLPVGMKHVNNMITVTPGFSGLADVGGGYSQPGDFHGKSGTKVAFDGMQVENSSGNSSYQINSLSVQEFVAQTSGIGADTNADGAVINTIPKEGGNTFSGVLNGFYTDQDFESGNLSPELEALGVREPNKTIKMFDQGYSLGGPIIRDRLWYFGAVRSWGFSRKVPGVTWNQSTAPGAPPTGQPRLASAPQPAAEAAWRADPSRNPLYEVVNFVPWVDRPEDRFSGRLEWYDSYLFRITFQASQNNKINFTFDEQDACNCGSTTAGRVQETQPGYRFDPNRLLQGTWTSTMTSRLLLEAGGTAALSQWNSFWMPGVDPTHIEINDTGRGIRYGETSFQRGDPNNTDRYSQRFSLSYVTGSHNFKAGTQVEQTVDNVYRFHSQNIGYRFNDFVPNQITQFSGPSLRKDRARDLGIYAQDQWTIDRLTLNLGVRYEKHWGYSPAQDDPGIPTSPESWKNALRFNQWLPEGSFEKTGLAPDWNDISPRVGMAYDLFGDGRTAIKASLGRYVAQIDNEITQLNNPFVRSVDSAKRAWNDANENYIPDCDLGNFDANGECGAIDNSFFGAQDPNAIRWDPDVLTGLRDANWDLTTEVQQELFDGFSVTVGYYFNTAGYSSENNSKNRVLDNEAVGPNDYDEYCVTAPVDPGLPNGGGYEICGLYDIQPGKFGQVEDIWTRTDKFGEAKYRNHFFNVTIDGRLPNGITVGGGFDTGTSSQDKCFVVDSPQELLYCKEETPASAQTQVKFFGSAPLPYDFLVSAAYQNLSGPNYEANRFFATDDLRFVNGRTSLASGGSGVIVPLVAPEELFGDRITRFDFRVSKFFNYDRFRFQINFDAYNLGNTSSIRSINSAYGSRWGFPNTIIDPRLLQFGGQITF